MALSEILARFKTEIEPTISLNSIAAGAGRISTVIDNTSVRATKGKYFWKAKTGTTPTVNSLFKLYHIEQSNGVNNVKGGGGALGDVDAAASPEPTNAILVSVIQVTATSNVSYSERSQTIYDPGAKFSAVWWNATGVTSNATADTPGVQWVGSTDEAQ